MPETIILDPTEVATGRTQLDISAYVKAEGVDWGDAEIAAYMAEMARGSAPVDFRLPNRQITLPMNVKASGSTSFVQARQLLQKKVARIQQEGGWIKRTTASGTLFADVVNATLKFGGDWMQATRGVDINAELHLEAIPDWYGAEVTLADHVETVNSELIWTESNIAGDYPGRLRLVVDNDQASAPQMGLMYGIRSRHYSNSTTAQLVYGGQTCTPLDSAAVVSGDRIRHSNLSTSWTPVLSTDQGAAALTHTGTYRVWAKALGSPSVVSPVDPLQVRLIWDVGDFALPTENRPADLPITNQYFYPLDLGEVRLDRVPAGAHRWRGAIQAKGPNGGEAIEVQKLWFQPVDEGAGVLRAPLNTDPGFAGYSARDEFNQTAGVLTGKTAPVGGVWQGAGDTDDFVVNATSHLAQRTSVSDTGGLWAGRFATLPIGQSVIAAQVDIATTDVATQFSQGLVVRYTNPTNHLMWYVKLGTLSAAMTVSGVVTTLKIADVSRQAGSVYTLRMMVDTSGRWFGWWGLQGGALSLVGLGTRTELAAGGQLSSGGMGFYDANTLTTVGVTRTYNNFAAWVPTPDAVLHPNQSAELRTEGMFREEATGAAFGPVSHVVGDLPRIPPSGSEGRTVQFFLKGSRGDFDTLPDTATDDISARATYRPSYLFVA